MSWWDSVTSGVSNLYDKGMDFFSGDNSDNKQPTSIDPNNNSIDGDINGDGKSLLEAALQNDNGELDANGEVKGYSPVTELYGQNEGTGSILAGTKEISEVSGMDSGDDNSFEWEEEDEFGMTPMESEENKANLMKTYGTADINKIKEYNMSAVDKSGGDVSKFMRKDRRKKRREGRDGKISEGLGKGLQGLGESLLSNSFKYDQF